MLEAPQAYIDKAIRLSTKHDKPYFVVYEAGEYDVCTEPELDGFFCGYDVVFCTLDLE